MPDSPAILLENLTYAWPRQPALLDIGHFALARGEKVMLAGPSGSGKSTLLGLVTGILNGAEGTCDVLGRPMNRLPGAARDRLRADEIGYIFQSFNLVPYLSVLDNVTLPCSLSPARAKVAGNAKRTARSLLEALGLPGEIASMPVTSLSTGQQQRVAAARALIGAPPLIVADEPTSALDEDRKNAFLDLLLTQAGKAGTAILFVSHDGSLAGHFDRTVELAAINAAAKEAI